MIVMMTPIGPTGQNAENAHLKNNEFWSNLGQKFEKYLFCRKGVISLSLCSSCLGAVMIFFSLFRCTFPLFGLTRLGRYSGRRKNGLAKWPKIYSTSPVSLSTAAAALVRKLMNFKYFLRTVSIDLYTLSESVMGTTSGRGQAL